MSSPNVVRINTRVAGCAATMRRVAAIPSSTGMRMSISTTSGRSRRASVTASSPSPASPTTVVSGSVSKIFRRPTRTSAWSSAIRTVVIGSAAGRARRSRRSAAGVEAAAVERHTLAHAHEAVPAGCCRRRGSGAVVGDLELERVRRVADLDPRPRLARVLQRVRQRLLHDPVGGQLDPDWELAWLTFDLELDGKAGFPELPDENRNVGEAGLGREWLVRAATEHAQQTTHLGQRAAARSL